MFVNITEDEKGQPFEVFINLGKAGGSAMAAGWSPVRVVTKRTKSSWFLSKFGSITKGVRIS